MNLLWKWTITICYLVSCVTFGMHGIACSNTCSSISPLKGLITIPMPFFWAASSARNMQRDFPAPVAIRTNTSCPWRTGNTASNCPGLRFWVLPYCTQHIASSCSSVAAEGGPTVKERSELQIALPCIHCSLAKPKADHKFTFLDSQLLHETSTHLAWNSCMKRLPMLFQTQISSIQLTSTWTDSPLLNLHCRTHSSLVDFQGLFGVNKEASPDPWFWGLCGLAWDYDNSIIKTTHKTTHSTPWVISSSRLSPRFSAREEPVYKVRTGMIWQSYWNVLMKSFLTGALRLSLSALLSKKLASCLAVAAVWTAIFPPLCHPVSCFLFHLGWMPDLHFLLPLLWPKNQ